MGQARNNNGKKKRDKRKRKNIHTCPSLARSPPITSLSLSLSCKYALSTCLCKQNNKKTKQKKVVLKKVDSTLDDVASEFDASRSGRMGGRALSETGSRKGSVVGAIMSDFDMSRSGRVGRVLSDASRNGRLGRMGSNSSIVSDTSKSGKAVVPGTRAGAGAAGAVAGLFAPKLGGLTEAEGEAANGAAAADNQV